MSQNQIPQAGKITIGVVVIIIVLSLIIGLSVGLTKKESYETPISQPLGPYVQSMVPRQAVIDTTLGAMQVNENTFNEIGSNSLGQVTASNNITNELQEIQSELNSTNHSNNNNIRTQLDNQLIQNTKMNTIFEGGLNRRGGLTEYESNRLVACSEYQFPNGVVPDIYGDILQQQQNSAACIVQSPMILNVKSNQSYVPSVNYASTDVLKGQYKVQPLM